MSDQQFPYTLRLLHSEDGGWGRVLIGRQNPDWPFHPEDIMDASDNCSFATPESAMDDARQKLGGEPSPDARDYKVWVENKR